MGNEATAPTALSLAALGGVTGLFFLFFRELLRLVLGETDESGRGWPLGRSAQLDLGVESSSEPKLKKSLKSGEGSDVSMRCSSLSGVSRYRRMRSLESVAARGWVSGRRGAFVRDVRGGVLVVSCSSIISSRMRAFFCRNASKSATSCSVTAIKRLLRLVSSRYSAGMGGTGDTGGVEYLEDLLEDGVFEVLLSRLSDE